MLPSYLILPGRFKQPRLFYYDDTGLAEYTEDILQLSVTRQLFSPGENSCVLHFHSGLFTKRTFFLLCLQLTISGVEDECIEQSSGTYGMGQFHLLVTDSNNIQTLSLLITAHNVLLLNTAFPSQTHWPPHSLFLKKSPGDK